MAVKDRQMVTDDMFDPLRETIDLLKLYEHEMPDEVYLQLQVCSQVIVIYEHHMPVEVYTQVRYWSIHELVVYCESINVFICFRNSLNDGAGV